MSFIFENCHLIFLDSSFLEMTRDDNRDLEGVCLYIILKKRSDENFQSIGLPSGFHRDAIGDYGTLLLSYGMLCFLTIGLP
jgi:hypothetical protein